MKQLALTIATTGFFLMAIVGWFSAVPVYICSLRALAGAAGLYLLVRVAGAVAIRIVIDTARQVLAEQGETEKRKP